MIESFGLGTNSVAAAAAAYNPLIQMQVALLIFIKNCILNINLMV